MNINDVFIKCVEKWAENELDDRINFAMDKFDDWIKDFDEEEKDILCKILEKFNYYPLGNINKLIKELSDESRKVFGVSNDDSVISVVTQLMGMTYSEMEKSIEHLLGLGYLVCINGYVVIAKIGEKLLEEKNMRNFFSNDENKGLKKEVLDIYETYIPIGFEW